MNVHTKACSYCQVETQHHLLRYKTFLMTKWPIFPTGNTYYLICDACDHYEALSGEGNIMKILYKNRLKEPVRYHKFSFEGLIRESFEYQIGYHLTNIKKNTCS